MHSFIQLTYLSALGRKSFIRFITYLAAHSPTPFGVSKITNRIFNYNSTQTNRSFTNVLDVPRITRFSSDWLF